MKTIVLHYYLFMLSLICMVYPLRYKILVGGGGNLALAALYVVGVLTGISAMKAFKW